MNMLNDNPPIAFDPDMILSATKDSSISVPEFVTVNNNGSLTIPVNEKETLTIAYLDWCKKFYLETGKRKTFVVDSTYAKDIIKALYSDKLNELQGILDPAHSVLFSAKAVSQLCFVILTMYCDFTTDLVKFGDFELIGTIKAPDYIIEMKIRGCNFITLKICGDNLEVSTGSISSKHPQAHTLYMSLITILDMWYMLEDGVNISSLSQRNREEDLDKVAHQYLLQALPVTVKRVVETDFLY